MTRCISGDQNFPTEDETGAHCDEHGVPLLWHAPDFVWDDLLPQHGCLDSTAFLWLSALTDKQACGSLDQEIQAAHDAGMHTAFLLALDVLMARTRHPPHSLTGSCRRRSPCQARESPVVACRVSVRYAAASGATQTDQLHRGRRRRKGAHHDPGGLADRETASQQRESHHAVHPDPVRRRQGLAVT